MVNKSELEERFNAYLNEASVIDISECFSPLSNVCNHFVQHRQWEEYNINTNSISLKTIRECFFVLGWYVGTVKQYIKDSDTIVVEFDTKVGVTYKCCIEKEANGRKGQTCTIHREKAWQL